MPLRPGFDVDRFNRFGKDFLPGFVGLLITEVSDGMLKGELELRKALLAPNGYLHAGTVVTLADSCCVMGCMASFPEGVAGFTTVELKTNFLRTATAGGLGCRATLAHAGRTTQVWDAAVEREEDGKPLALFRCTQYLLADPRGRQERT